MNYIRIIIRIIINTTTHLFSQTEKKIHFDY